MEEQIKKMKVSLRISAVATVVTCSSLVIGHRLDMIRTVDFIQIFAGGICFGIMIMNVVLLQRMKSGK
jgi:hypothetical protein